MTAEQEMNEMALRCAESTNFLKHLFMFGSIDDYCKTGHVFCIDFSNKKLLDSYWQEIVNLWRTSDRLIFIDHFNKKIYLKPASVRFTKNTYSPISKEQYESITGHQGD
jgi:hypothetical protein